MSVVKSLLTFILISALLSVAAFFFVFSPSYVSIINYKGQIIRIDRDQYGIPYIQAPDRRALLYAWGNAISEDRLFQMTFRSIFVQGRLSQFIGNRTLQVDIMMRDVGLYKVASHISEKMKKENREAYDDLEAFAQGVNFGVSRRWVLPIEFYVMGLKWEPWTVQQIISLFKLMDWNTAFGMIEEAARSSLLDGGLSVEEVNRVMPNTKQTWAFSSTTVVREEQLPNNIKSKDFVSTALFQPLSIEKIMSLGMPDLTISAEGSNAWVISGEHTESGKPLLVGDPHLDNSIPSHWYPLRATYRKNGKEIKFSGVSMPGTPIGYGKTDYLAASMTTIYTDTQDLYKEQIKGGQYLLDNQWKSLKVRKEKIIIKTPEGLQTYDHTVRLTHRGPIINYLVTPIGTLDLRGKSLSVAWTGYNDDYQSLIVSYTSYEATTLEEVKHFLTYGTSYVPSFSMLLATADNHIFYRQGGVNPIKHNFDAGYFVKDGTTSQHDWVGFVKPEDRLMLMDPKRGYIVACNNKAGPDSALGGYFSRAIYTARADRIQELIQREIAAGRKIGLNFAKQVLHDTVDVYCRQILPQIQLLLPQAKLHLSEFSCDFKASSYQATQYQIFLIELYHLIKPEEAIKNFSLYAFHNSQQYAFNYIHEAFKGDQQKKQVLKEAWINMETMLKDFFKNSERETWEWGKLHRDTMVHQPLGLHPFLSKLYNRESKGWGNLHTPNVGKMYKSEFGNFAISHRANLRSIFDFGGESWWIIDSGVSENLLSAHYDDQWKLFIAEKLLKIDLPVQKSEDL